MAMTPSPDSSATNGSSFVQWSAILAGTALACAISLILLQFGQTVGLAIPERYDDSYTAGKIIAIGVWLLWVQLMASMAGGYVAGRMSGTWTGSGYESEVRDGAHGLIAWATSTLAAFGFAAIGALLATLAVNTGVDAAQAANAEVQQIPEALARKYTVIFGFAMAASSIVSAVVAYWLGTVGGDHRDHMSNNGRFSVRKKK